jgi:hypothetical protein
MIGIKLPVTPSSPVGLQAIPVGSLWLLSFTLSVWSRLTDVFNHLLVLLIFFSSFLNSRLFLFFTIFCLFHCFSSYCSVISKFKGTQFCEFC